MSLTVNGTRTDTIPNFQPVEELSKVQTPLQDVVTAALEDLQDSQEQAPTTIEVEAVKIDSETAPTVEAAGEIPVAPDADQVPTNFFSDACSSAYAKLPSLPSYEQVSGFGVTYGLPALTVAGAAGTVYFAIQAIKNARLLKAVNDKTATDVEAQLVAHKKLTSDVLNIQRGLAVGSGIATLAAGYAAASYNDLM